MVVGFGVLALVVGNPRVMPGWEDREDKEVDHETNATSEAVIPPLDAVQTAQTETATFALG